MQFPHSSSAFEQARKLRVQYAGAIYHVLNRGDRREDIFKNDFDRQCFLETLGEACAKTQWEVHAYGLMGNHLHPVLATPLPNLVEGMKWFLGTYTARFNRRHQLFGHLFSGRYKALMVDGSGHGCLRTVCEYVHLNPVRVDRLLGEMHIPQETAAGRAQFEQRMAERRRQESGEEWKELRRGWGLGGAQFRQELLVPMDQRMGEHHYGSERLEGAEEKAARLVREELTKAGWTEDDLRQRPKGDPVQVAAALRLRQETTVTLKWISQRLAMGAWTHLNRRLYEQRRAEETKPS